MQRRIPRNGAARLLLTAAMAIVALSGGCSGDDVGDEGGGDEDGGRATSTAGGDASTVPSTTAAPTSTTIVQVPRATGREAIDALLAAWRAGDRAGALSVADPVQVDLLFAVPAEPGEDRGCNQGGVNPATQCVFRLPSGELQVRASPRPGGFIVDFVFLTRN